MASTAVRLAVQQYRKIVLDEYKVEHEQEKLDYALSKLSKDETHDYAKLTTEVDAGTSLAMDEIERNPRWVWSTRWALLRKRVYRSGTDDNRVDLKS